jgi:hypothetical protein
MSSRTETPAHRYEVPTPGDVYICVHGNGQDRDVTVAHVSSVTSRLRFLRNPETREEAAPVVESWTFVIRFGVNQYVAKHKGDGWTRVSDWHPPTEEESKWPTVREALRARSGETAALPVPTPRRREAVA